MNFHKREIFVSQKIKLARSLIGTSPNVSAVVEPFINNSFQMNFKGILKVLHLYNSDMSVSAQNGKSALITGYDMDHHEILQILLQHKSDILQYGK